MIFGFSACGCNHEWQDATCIEPKTCSLCGATEGEPLGHIFENATCTKPKTCSRCGESKGKALGHDYVDGYCTKCYIKDPNYIDLNNFGFTNMYGMNTWLNIIGFDFSQNRVIIRGSDFNFNIYYDNYWYSGKISVESISTVTSVNSNLLTSMETNPYTLLSNDVVQYYGGGGLGPVTITERVVSRDNSKIILKIYDEAKSGNFREYWYVPADLLDFSTVTKGEKEYTYFVYFK